MRCMNATNAITMDYNIINHRIDSKHNGIDSFMIIHEGDEIFEYYIVLYVDVLFGSIFNAG